MVRTEGAAVEERIEVDGLALACPRRAPGHDGFGPRGRAVPRLPDPAAGLARVRA